MFTILAICLKTIGIGAELAVPVLVPAPTSPV